MWRGNESLSCFWLKNWVCFEQQRQTDEFENHAGHLACALDQYTSPDGALFHRIDFYQQGLRKLGKTTIERYSRVDVTEASHLIENRT
ncbi:MAG TPA: hypothetical protein VKV20_07200 [Ktedonobacteraceae bacterium]|nr:hypothetical protein [Ktedonobacteraceae bacterium]